MKRAPKTQTPASPTVVTQTIALLDAMSLAYKMSKADSYPFRDATVWITANQRCEMGVHANVRITNPDWTVEVCQKGMRMWVADPMFPVTWTDKLLHDEHLINVTFTGDEAAFVDWVSSSCTILKLYDKWTNRPQEA